jgi:hypothetical protein
MREDRQVPIESCTPLRKAVAALVLVTASLAFVWMVVWPLVPG